MSVALEKYIEPSIVRHDGLALPRLDWSAHLDQLLVEKSQQDHIVKYEPSDMDFRFSSVEEVREWRRRHFSRNDPIIAWLGTATNELAGIAWIENAHLKSGIRLFGVRVYEGFENQGYGTVLANKVHRMYDEKCKPGETTFKMRVDNNAAFVIGAVKLGYKLRGEDGAVEVVKMSRRVRPAIQTYVRDRKQ